MNDLFVLKITPTDLLFEYFFYTLISNHFSACHLLILCLLLQGQTKEILIWEKLIKYGANLQQTILLPSNLMHSQQYSSCLLQEMGALDIYLCTTTTEYSCILSKFNLVQSHAWFIRGTTELKSTVLIAFRLWTII